MHRSRHLPKGLFGESLCKCRHYSQPDRYARSSVRGIASEARERERLGQEIFNLPKKPPLYPTRSSIPDKYRSAVLKDAKPFSAFLTDSFSREHTYLRISLTERCNLRCTYCMPAEGVPLSSESTQLTTPEIILLSSLFVEEGVDKIRLTGGEPTVRRDLIPLMQELGRLRKRGLKELCITSNGISLKNKLEDMVEAGLSGVNISLDTLEPGLFEIMTRRRGFEQVMACIERILAMKRLGARIKLKINVVVIRGVNESEILRFVDFGRDKDLEVRFIEYMPFDGNRWQKKKMLSYREMLDSIRGVHPNLCRVEDAKSETSKTWQVPGFSGRIGFITSMTDNFCGGCNRLRITSDGNLKVCLFGNAEVSLRELVRRENAGQPISQENYESMRKIYAGEEAPSTSEWRGSRQMKEELLQVIGKAVGRKKQKHAGMGALEKMPNRPMILIDDNQKITGYMGMTQKSRLCQVAPFPLPTSLLIPGNSHHARLFSTAGRRNSDIGDQKDTSNARNIGDPQPSASSPSLTHLTGNSEAHVVSITSKPSTQRSATAIGHVSFSSSRIMPLIRAGNLPKGDISSVARVAGIMAAKRTSDIVPLCHPGVNVEGIRCWIECVPSEMNKAEASAVEWHWDDDISNEQGASLVNVTTEDKALNEADASTESLDPLSLFLRTPLGLHGGVRLAATVSCEGKTGVEMEALCAVVGSALSVVDMVKSADKGCVIGGLEVVRKEGGRSGEFKARGW